MVSAQQTRGELLLKARVKADLTQGEVGELWAKALGRLMPYSQAWVSGVEHGVPIQREIDLVILAQVLGIPERQLLDAPVGAATTPSSLWRARATRRKKSETPSHTFGTTDRVTVSTAKPGLQLDFISVDLGRRRSVVLTKCPVPLAGAFETALSQQGSQEGTFEYTGENLRGRVCVFGESSSRYAWVAEFVSPATGFLIHMKHVEMQALRAQLMSLPFHALPTD